MARSPVLYERNRPKHHPFLVVLCEHDLYVCLVRLALEPHGRERAAKYRASYVAQRGHYDRATPRSEGGSSSTGLWHRGGATHLDCDRLTQLLPSCPSKTSRCSKSNIGARGEDAEGSPLVRTDDTGTL